MHSGGEKPLSNQEITDSGLGLTTSYAREVDYETFMEVVQSCSEVKFELGQMSTHISHSHNLKPFPLNEVIDGLVSYSKQSRHSDRKLYDNSGVVGFDQQTGGKCQLKYAFKEEQNLVGMKFNDGSQCVLGYSEGLPDLACTKVHINRMGQHAYNNDSSHEDEYSDWRWNWDGYEHQSHCDWSDFRWWYNPENYHQHYDGKAWRHWRKWHKPHKRCHW